MENTQGIVDGLTSMDLSSIQSLFLTNGILIVIFGYIFNYIRYWPNRIYSLLLKRIFYTVEFRDSDIAYDWFEKWYSSRKVRINSYLIKGKYDQDPELIPNYGINWLWWNGILLLITKQQQQSDQKFIVSNGDPNKRNETFLISFITTSFSKVNDFVYEITPERNKGYSINHASSYGDWNQTKRSKKRPVTTMYGTVYDVLKDAKKFLDNKEWYVSNSLPWRRGYLLYGPPGNGKSSTVSVLASELDMNIYVIDSKIDDAKLNYLIGQIPEKSIVLIEDVDCFFINRKKEEGVSMTFSGLLNALDGVSSSDGRILILTTNHPELLDEALVREGRCDRKFFFGPPTEEDFRSIENRFSLKNGALSGYNSYAAVQSEILRIKNEEYGS